MAVDFSYSSHDHPQAQEQNQDQDRNQDEEQEEEEEEEYIDMEVSSYYSNFLKTSPIHQPNEFEFMTQSGPLNLDHLSTTSPADELFYNGKLLPLHHHYDHLSSIHTQKELYYSTPLTTNATNTPTLGTPFRSCNTSPVESCQVSKELNPDEYFLECSNYDEGSFHGSRKSMWSKKFKLIKNSSLLSSKIRASQAYFKYLFGKPIANNKDGKDSKRTTFGETKERATTTTTTAMIAKDDTKVCHRRSFSGAFKLRTATKTMALMSSSSSGSSSSSSSNSNASSDVHLFKRSISADLEVESAVAGAIAHCKQSQSKVLRSRKTLSEIGLYNSVFEASEEQ